MARKTKSERGSRNYNGLKRAEPSLPGAWYHDTAQYQAELSSIWNESWIYLCRSAAINEARSFQTLSIGRQSILVLRTDVGELAGYFNVCRHRGSVLVTEPEGALRSPLITCPYHQWCYASDDGRLTGTSSFGEPLDFNRAAFNLYPISVREWRGFIFINLDPAAIWDVETALQRGAENLREFPLEKMVVGHRWIKSIACNWKIFWENFNECLHCPNVHPNLADLVPIYKRRLINEKDRPDWREHMDESDPKFRGGLRAGAETWSKDGSAQGRILPGLSDADVARGQTYAVALPGSFIAGYGDHVRIVRLLPQGPEAIELTVEWLFPQETLDDLNYDLMNVVDFTVSVLEEDSAACELNQRGLHAVPFDAGVLMPEEYHLKTFHDWLREKLSS